MIYTSSPRSVSLPIESNAIMARVTRELKKLKALEETSTSAAETISIGLCGIADLYKCIGQMLSSPLTQQSLSLRQHEKPVGELLEVSAELLEVCTAAQEMAVQMRESSGDLRSALGGKQDSQESRISRFVCLRKAMAKRSKEMLLSIRRIGGESFASLGFSDDADHERVSAVIQALRCISIISVSVHENLLLFLGLKPKSGGRKSIFSKLMRKGKLGCEGEELSMNELENVDAAICGLPSESDETMRFVCKRLEALESGVQGIESGLEGVFRQLTQTRVLLLKIYSP